MCSWTRIIAPNILIVKGFPDLMGNFLKFFLYLHYNIKISVYLFSLSVLLYNTYDTLDEGTQCVYFFYYPPFLYSLHV
jgi:hypothetical protein